MQVRQTDISGNLSVAASLGAVTVDHTVAAPGVKLDADTGSSSSDGVTNNGQVDVTLASDVASWQYSTDGGAHWTTGGGTSFTLASGVYADGAVQVRQTDISGNLSAAAGLGAVTVDHTVAPPSVKLVPLPVVQCAPLSVLNCQLATSLANATSTWPLLVMPSLPLLPVSASSFTLGGATV